MYYDEIACCIPMLHALQDGDFEYDPVYKRIIGFVTNKNSKEFFRRVLAYCPYCGAKQPDLTLAYDDELDAVLGENYCDITEDEIPEEFKTDEWWRKRGL